MRPIDPTLVDEVWREIISYPADRIESEAQSFLAQQPHVVEFAQAVAKSQAPAVQKAAFGLCFLLFKIVEQSLDRPFPLLTEERIRRAYEETTGWLELERAGSMSPDSVLAGASTDPGYPALVQRILSILYGDDLGSTEYDEGVRASFVLMLRTLGDALDAAAGEG